MPVIAKESGGQVLRGFCPTCEQVTKRKDAFGSWVSRCAHPGKNYQGRMTPGGKKSIPVIPDTLDRGQLPGAVEQALEARSDVEGYAEQIERKPVDAVRGMIDPTEARDDERALRPGQYASGVPMEPRAQRALEEESATEADPLGFDARSALQGIATYARGMAAAISALQRQVFEFEQQIAEQAVEYVSRTTELVKAQRDVIELELRNADLENDVDRLEGEVIELGGSVVTAESAEKKEFDPLDVQF